MILYNKVQTSTHSSQALAPHKHWLQWPKTNDLGGFSMTKTDDRVLNDRKTDDLEGFLMTVLFQVTEQKPEYLQNRNKNIPMTGNFWNQDDAQVVMWHRPDEIATDEWLSLNRNGSTATQQTQNKNGNILTSLRRMLTVLVSKWPSRCVEYDCVDLVFVAFNVVES